MVEQAPFYSSTAFVFSSMGPARLRSRAIMAHLVGKNFGERANAVLLLGILWGGLAELRPRRALSYDIAY